MTFIDRQITRHDKSPDSVITAEDCRPADNQRDDNHSQKDHENFIDTDHIDRCCSSRHDSPC